MCQIQNYRSQRGYTKGHCVQERDWLRSVGRRRATPTSARTRTCPSNSLRWVCDTGSHLTVSASSPPDEDHKPSYILRILRPISFVLGTAQSHSLLIHYVLGASSPSYSIAARSRTDWCPKRWWNTGLVHPMSSPRQITSDTSQVCLILAILTLL